MGIFLLQPKQHRHGAQVRANVIEVLGRNLAGHDAIFNAAVGKCGEHFRELADFEPDDFIHQRSQGGVRLAIEGNGDQSLYAALTCLSGENQRQRAIAGDDAKGVEGWVHGGGPASGWANVSGKRRSEKIREQTRPTSSARPQGASKNAPDGSATRRKTVET